MSWLADREILPTSRQATQWTFAVMGLVLVLGILFFMTWLVRFNPVTWDLTEVGLYTLSEQTVGVLEELQTPVAMMGFVQGGVDPELERLLRAYSDRSDRVEYELVDPVARPSLTEQYQVRQPGTVVVEAGDGVRFVEEPNEAKLTNAILSVVRGEAVPVCFLVGHGERSVDQDDRQGMAMAAQVLRQTNYAVEEINLAAQPEVPERCRVLAIVAPALDLLDDEVAAIDAYLEEGGGVLVLLEPGSQLPNFFALLRERGIVLAGDVVIDTEKNARAMGGGIEMPLVDGYPPHPITEGFRLMTIYPTARSIRGVTPEPLDLDLRPLAVTSESSWGETDFQDFGGNRAARWDEGEDIRGPLALVVAVSRDVEETPTEARRRERAGEPPPVGDPVLVVAGDADFASNRFFQAQGNGDLFLNAVNWLSGQEDLIAIRPKNPQNKRVPLTDERRLAVLLIAVIGVPLVPAVFGLITLIKKVK